MAKAKKSDEAAKKKPPKTGKKEPKRLVKENESSDVPAIPSTSKWDGRKIAKVSALFNAKY